MAIESIPKTSQVRIWVKTTSPFEEKQKTSSKTFSNVYSEADEEEVWEVIDALGKLYMYGYNLDMQLIKNYSLVHFV